MGFCSYKATSEIKRRLAVDTPGFPFFTRCTKTNVSDDAESIEMLTLNTIVSSRNLSSHFLRSQMGSIEGLLDLPC